jgi:hypothetical protein
MSKKKDNGDIKEFLQQNAYLFAFTFVCGLGLASYMIANEYFDQIFVNDHTYVLNSASVKGVWVSKSGISCPNIPNLNVDSCVDSSYFDNYKTLNTTNSSFDDKGRLLFSTDTLFVSGMFEKREQLNKDIWPNVYIGDFNIKINGKQVVYQNVVWDTQSTDSILKVFKLDDGYIVVVSPWVSMVNRTKQFWVYRIYSNSDMVHTLKFVNDQSRRSLLESSEVSFNQKGENVYVFFSRQDPSLMGNSEVELYRLEDNLIYDQRVLLLNGY